MLHLLILVIILGSLTVISYFLSKVDDPSIFIVSALCILACMLFITFNSEYYYSHYEYQKPIERMVIKYDENNIPIDTVYIHPNL